jgi:pimeloyl-ACP methyl ester carboxylesterase
MARRTEVGGGARVGTLRVPGASLYYKVRGSGSVLLLLPSGGGDADSPDQLADHLVDRYLVVSYDRRGMSRSRLDDVTCGPDIGTHGADAHHLLASLASGPALVFGCSTGAVIGLELLLRHPGQVRMLVAHEPPLPALLGEAEREVALRAQQEMEVAYRTGGRLAAMRKLGSGLRAELTDREPGVQWSPPSPRIIANAEFFIANDSGATCRYNLDLADRAALKVSPGRIVPARGATSQAGVAYRGADALASLTGARLRIFPGGHEGYLTHPASFAAMLDDVLRERAA